MSAFEWPAEAGPVPSRKDPELRPLRDDEIQRIVDLVNGTQQCPRVEFAISESPLFYPDNDFSGTRVELRIKNVISLEAFAKECLLKLGETPIDQKLIVVLYRIFDGEVLVGVPDDLFQDSYKETKKQVVLLRSGFYSRPMTPTEMFAVHGE